MSKGNTLHTCRLNHLFDYAFKIRSSYIYQVFVWKKRTNGEQYYIKNIIEKNGREEHLRLCFSMDNGNI